ncbi:hypothetical protein [Coleofasciculus sp. FACHB-1120]|nr:hypothetical protein [Coleofasciculus sp. FACHB-1120]MBD2743181.1 hypothetical protein [Coleofasciculus sp. FACHB-1120]
MIGVPHSINLRKNEGVRCRVVVSLSLAIASQLFFSSIDYQPMTAD